MASDPCGLRNLLHTGGSFLAGADSLRALGWIAYSSILVRQEVACRCPGFSSWGKVTSALHFVQCIPGRHIRQHCILPRKLSLCLLFVLASYQCVID